MIVCTACGRRIGIAILYYLNKIRYGIIVNKKIMTSRVARSCIVVSGIITVCYTFSYFTVKPRASAI